MHILGLYRLLQSWMIDFIYDFDGIYVESVSRHSFGVTISAKIRDPDTIKEDMLADLANVKYNRLFKHLSISVDEDEIDVSFESNIDNYVANLIRKHLGKLRKNNANDPLNRFLNACESEIANLAADFRVSMEDTRSGIDWETEVHDQLLLVLNNMIKNAGIPIGNMIELYLWEE